MSEPAAGGIAVGVGLGIVAGFGAGRMAWARASERSRTRVERLAADLAETARGAAAPNSDREPAG